MGGVKQTAWCALLSALTFWGAFGLRPYYDDWVFTSQAALALELDGAAAYLAAPVGRHWSPLWNLMALVNVSIAGWDDDWLIRGVTLLVHMGAAAWLLYVGRQLAIGTPALLLAAAVLSVHHVRAAALFSFDTYSQVLADAATWIAAGLALVAVHGRTPLRHWRFTAAAVIPLVALLVKEQAAAGAVAVLVLIGLAWRAARDPRDRRRGAWLALLVATGVAAFAALRAAAGVDFADTEAYRLCAACMPRNAGLIGGALVLPVRTLTVVDAWRAGGWTVLALAATGALAIAAVGASAMRDGRGRLVAALLVLATLPVALLAHVGELHTHTATFWFALLLAVAVDRVAIPVRWRPAAVAVAALYLLGLLAGQQANLADMRATGELAAVWRARYDAAVAPLPPGAVVLVRGQWPEKYPGDYSLYRLTSPEFITLMWVWARRTPADRRLDVQFEWSEPDRQALAALAASGMAFELRRRGQALVVGTYAP